MTLITLEEWLSVLSSLDRPAEDAFTICQWGEKIGKEHHAASRWVRDGLSNGWMERATVIVEELTGKRRKAVGFRLTTTQGGVACETATGWPPTSARSSGRATRSRKKSSSRTSHTTSR